MFGGYDRWHLEGFEDLKPIANGTDREVNRTKTENTGETIDAGVQSAIPMRLLVNHKVGGEGDGIEPVLSRECSRMINRRLQYRGTYWSLAPTQVLVELLVSIRRVSIILQRIG